MKVSFNKFSVLLMYVMIITLLVYVLITKEYPPTSFIIAYFGFWIAQSVVTAKLYRDKKEREDCDTLKEFIAKYINEENADALIEKYLDIKPKRRSK